MNHARTILSSLFRINLVIVLIWFISLVTGGMLKLEFTSGNYETTYFSIGIYGIPALGFIVFFRNIDPAERWHEWLSRFAGGMIVAIVVFFMMAMGALSNMCTYTPGKTLFTNNKTSSEKIIERWYGCGATDSSPSNLSIVKATYYTPFLVRITPVDTASLDKNQWQRMVDLNSR